MNAASLITKKQASALHFIAQYTDRHGYCPTLAEVCVGVGMSPKSCGVMCSRAARLRKLGFLVKGKKHKNPLVISEIGRRFVQQFPAGITLGGAASAPGIPSNSARPVLSRDVKVGGQEMRAGTHSHMSED